MTLILGISSPWLAGMATDRLVTLANQRTGEWAGNHDQAANKLLVLITVDAAVLIGFCGSAYIGDVPTDNWIADTVSPGANFIGRSEGTGSFGFKIPSRLRLHQCFNRIRLGLSRHREGAGVTILCVGWRVRRRLRIPINVVLRGASRLSSSSELSLRPSWPLRPRLQGIGARFDYNDCRDTITDNGGLRPWDRDSMVQNLTAAIRRKAAVDRTVGPDVMSAVLSLDTLNGGGRAECCFDPIAARYATRAFEGAPSRQMVFYSPWFLLPNGYHAPTESTGEPGSESSFSMEGWELTVKDVPRGPGTPSNTAWIVPQSRPPRPGRR